MGRVMLCHVFGNVAVGLYKVPGLVPLSASWFVCRSVCVRQELFAPWSWVFLSVMQECSPESSSLMKAVPVDLHGVVLSPPSNGENPVPLGFPEICMGSAWRPECVSPREWLCPHLPALFPHSFYRISLRVLMLSHFMISMWRSKIAKGKKFQWGLLSRMEGAETKQGDVCAAPTAFRMVFILNIIQVQNSPRGS